MASCHYPSLAGPWGPLETVGSCNVPGTLVQSAGTRAAARWGLRSHREGRWPGDGASGNVPPRGLLQAVSSSRCLHRFGVQSLPGLEVKVTVRKPILAILKKTLISGKRFAVRLSLLGDVVCDNHTQAGETLVLALSLTGQVSFPLRATWALISKRRVWD